MPKIAIVYGNGTREEVTTEADSLEAFVNEKFGDWSVYQAFLDGGGKMGPAEEGESAHTESIEPTPAPTPEPTPAPTPEPTPAPTPEPTPAPKRATRA